MDSMVDANAAISWVDDEFIFESSGGTGTAEITGVYNYWNEYRLVYPNYIYSTILTEDKAAKAYKIAKTLRAKKLVKLNTIGQFIDLMDILLEEL